MNESIKITREQIFSINEILESLTGKYVSELKYAIKKNKDLLKSEIEAIKEASKSNIELYEEYEVKRFTKLRECCEKDSNNEPLVNAKDRNMIMLKKEKENEWHEFIKKLNEEYKDVIEQREEEIKDFNQFVSKEVEMEVFKIDQRIIPDELSQSDYEIIFPLINEEV